MYAKSKTRGKLDLFISKNSQTFYAQSVNHKWNQSSLFYKHCYKGGTTLEWLNWKVSLNTFVNMFSLVQIERRYRWFGGKCRGLHQGKGSRQFKKKVLSFRFFRYGVWTTYLSVTLIFFSIDVIPKIQ